MPEKIDYPTLCFHTAQQNWRREKEQNWMTTELPQTAEPALWQKWKFLNTFTT